MKEWALTKREVVDAVATPLYIKGLGQVPVEHALAHAAQKKLFMYLEADCTKEDHSFGWNLRRAGCYACNQELLDYYEVK